MAANRKLMQALRRSAPQDTVGTLVLVKVARSLYRRWETLAPAERRRLSGLAERVKQQAFDVRGSDDRDGAAGELERSSLELASALGDSAAADPAADPAEVEQLRVELARELGRLAGGQSQRRAA